MSCKIAVGLLVLGVVVVAWLGVQRVRERDAKPAEDRARSAAITPAPAGAPKPAEPGSAPRGVAPRWSLDADPEGPLRLEGQVLGPDGKGVGGAEVWLGSVPAKTTRTEDDGTFSFDKLVGRTYALSATTGELMGGPVRYKLTAHSDPIVIRLAEAAAVVVTVVDEARQPIKEAEVKLGEIAEHTANASARTSDKGTAKLAPVHPGWILIEASAAGYAPGSGFTTVGSAGATGELTITLRKGYAVSGRVVDEAGKPIGKARVTAGAGPWRDAGDAGDAGGTTTDDKGGFTIAALPPGRHTLLAVDGDHAPARSPPITVADKPVVGVEIVMKAGGVIAGTIVDAEHKPVPFATVRVAGKGQQIWQTAARQATSDQQGAFELRGLPRNKLQVRAESDAAASQIVDADLSDRPRLDGLELVLDVSGTIAGVVVDEHGAPVPEVQVNAFPDFLAGAKTDGLALAGLSSATTGGGGEFAVHGLPDGAYRLWAARHTGGFGDWGQQGTAAKTGDKDVRITLAAPGALTGKVVLAGKGAPPKLVTVAIGFQAPTPATDGVYQLKELTPGTYDVTIRGLEFAELIQHDVKIEPGKTTDLGTVTVSRGRKLSGKVVDKAGAPVAGAKGQGRVDADLGRGRRRPDRRHRHAVGDPLDGFRSGRHVHGRRDPGEGDQRDGRSSGSRSLAGRRRPRRRRRSARRDALAARLRLGRRQGHAERPVPEFTELVAGDYSICGLPITGDMTDMQFQRRLRENMQLLKVLCKAAHVTPSPPSQAFEIELPAMAPLPVPPR